MPPLPFFYRVERQYLTLISFPPCAPPARPPKPQTQNPQRCPPQKRIPRRSFRRIIRSVPKGKVSTYGKVAAAAGYPLYHRAVARLLRTAELQKHPWQRIVGAGGEIKLKGEAAAEQRLRLAMEGVKFRGKRVNMAIYEHTLRSWETLD